MVIVAYQIKGSDACSNIVAYFYLQTSTPVKGSGQKVKTLDKKVKKLNVVMLLLKLKVKKYRLT